MNDSPQKTAYYVIVPASVEAGKPAQIVGWNAMSYPADGTVPEFSPGDGYATHLMDGMTQEEWDNLRFNQNGCGGGLAYDDGKVVPYAPPTPVIPLKEQASAAMQQVQQQAAMTTAMGGTFGPVMQAYVRALRAILNGTDTTSTTLPAAPSDPTA